MGYQNSGNRSGPSHSGNYNGDNYGNNKDMVIIKCIPIKSEKKADDIIE